MRKPKLKANKAFVNRYDNAKWWYAVISTESRVVSRIFCGMTDDGGEALADEIVRRINMKKGLDKSPKRRYTIGRRGKVGKVG
jgi:hypothetical protein